MWEYNRTELGFKYKSWAGMGLPWIRARWQCIKNKNKSMALVYLHNTWDEKELVTIITFKITEKRQKFPGINLTKDMEGLY